MNDLEQKIRVRFAPSPTGYMHIGNFRTALYTYLFAKKNNGDFVLRIEDTDQKRSVPDALKKLINIINWAGFEYSEGVYVENETIIQKGKYGPYIQSERLEIYKKYANELLDTGRAYYCFCTPERLEKMREEQLKNKQAPMYDRSCLKFSKEEISEKIKKGDPYVIRQKIDIEGETQFDDLIRGKVTIKNELLDDQVLLKSDGYPTYNFANVVDDHLMEISHVIRGEEYISSTPKYIQLYQNFGWSEPRIAHLPLILNPNKTKLSKRQGDVSVEDYIKQGYLKESIINFIALLGWNPGQGNEQEIFSMNELIEKFSLERVHKAGAIFDVKKLDWINSQYIKELPIKELVEKARPFLEQKEFYRSAPEDRKTDEFLMKIMEIEKDRLKKLSDVSEENRFFFEPIQSDKKLLGWKDMDDDNLRKSLELSSQILNNIADSDWSKDNLEKKLLEAAGDKKGELLWPLRVSLTGENKSPSPFEVAWVLGKSETLVRIGRAIKIL